jgi:hypothetical protein
MPRSGSGLTSDSAWILDTILTILAGEKQAILFKLQSKKLAENGLDASVSDMPPCSHSFFSSERVPSRAVLQSLATERNEEKFCSSKKSARQGVSAYRTFYIYKHIRYTKARSIKSITLREPSSSHENSRNHYDI